MASEFERSLLDMLRQEGVIDALKFEATLRDHAEEGGALSRVLIGKGYASEADLDSTLGRFLSTPFFALSYYEIDPALLEIIPSDMAYRYMVVPIDKMGDEVTVALSDPANFFILKEIEQMTQCKVTPVISFESDIYEQIRQHYSPPEEAEKQSEASVQQEADPDTSRLPTEELEPQRNWQAQQDQQKGQYQEGQYQEGAEGQYQEGQYQQGQYQEGQYQEAQYQQGYQQQYQEGQYQQVQGQEGGEYAAAPGNLVVPFMRLSRYRIDPALTKLVPETFAKHYEIMPVDRDNDLLTVAMWDFSNMMALEELQAYTGCNVAMVRCTRDDIVDAIHRLYIPSDELAGMG